VGHFRVHPKYPRGENLIRPMSNTVTCRHAVKRPAVKWLPFVLAFMAVFLFSCSGRKDGSDISPGPDTKKYDLTILEKNGIDPSTAGFIVYDLSGGSVIISHNRKKPFIPASVMKTATAAAALDVLGPDYTFRTDLKKTGAIRDGTLEGDLYIIGGGDPHLRVKDLFGLARALRDSGIKKVAGNFYYDDSLFPGRTRIDDSMDTDASYNPGLGALSLDYNFIYAHWDLREELHWREISRHSRRLMKERTVDPGLFNIHLTPSLPMNDVSVIGKEIREGVNFYYRYSDDRETWEMFPGKIRNGAETLPVKEPGRYTAQVFSMICGITGIDIPGPKKGHAGPSADTVARHESPALVSICDIVLTYSNNLMAELVLMKTAEAVTGKAVGPENAAGVLAAYYKEKLPGVDWTGLRLKNGSGLTSETGITPEQLVSILVFADRQEYDGKKFIDLLPMSGWEWSLLSRLNGPDTAFCVHAKTGTINYAIALGGFLFTKSGKKLAFAVFFTDFDKRRAYDVNPDRRNKKEQRNVSEWYRNNRKAMDELVTDWTGTL